MDAAAAKSLTSIQARLLKSFDASILDIERYQQRVNNECAIFPEAYLFPYILPALAYGNLALKDPSYATTATKAMARLIKPAISALEGQVIETPKDTILSLDAYALRATEIGQINLALALYQRIGGNDASLLKIHKHLNHLLSVALKESEGKPINSYPNLTWPFDTMPCVVSLLLSDPDDKDYQAYARAHLEWIEDEGLHSPTKLPYGELGRELPRGCDLSLRLPLMHHFAPEQARVYYERYTQHHWAGMGFREWAVGFDGGVDIDSGPILFGMGLSATGNGLASAIVFENSTQMNVLMSLLAQRDQWVHLYHSKPSVREMIANQFESQFVPIDTNYFTGFLYGDAALFYMLTWEDYGLVIERAD